MFVQLRQYLTNFGIRVTIFEKILTIFSIRLTNPYLHYTKLNYFYVKDCHGCTIELQYFQKSKERKKVAQKIFVIIKRRVLLNVALKAMVNSTYMN